MTLIRQELPPQILNDCPVDASDEQLLERARSTIYSLRPFQEQAIALWKELEACYWLLQELGGVGVSVQAGVLLNRFLQIRTWVKTYLENHTLPEGAKLDSEKIPCHCGSGAHPRDCLKHPWGFHTHCAELDYENIRANYEDTEKSEELLKIEVQRLRAERTQYDCRYTLGSVADITGSHCPLDSPCLRCLNERLSERIASLEHDCEVMARGTEEAKSPDYNDSIIEELSRENQDLKSWIQDLRSMLPEMPDADIGHGVAVLKNEWAEALSVAKDCIAELGSEVKAGAKLCADRQERINVLEDINEVRSGEWCKQNRAEGRGGCGMCAVCCNELKERAEKAELKLATLLKDEDGEVGLYPVEEVNRWMHDSQELAEVQICDMCLGKGDSGTGSPCVCGGSGKMSDSIRNLRERAEKAELEVAGHRKNRSGLCSHHCYGEDPTCMICYGIGPQGASPEWMDIANKAKAENKELTEKLAESEVEIAGHRKNQSGLCSRHRYGEDPSCRICYGLGLEGVSPDWMERANKAEAENKELKDKLAESEVARYRAVDFHTEEESRRWTLEARVVELEQWVNDLHSGMYVNCVYCGHRYGPKDGPNAVPETMADILKAHIEQCPKHPLSAAKTRIAGLELEHEQGLRQAVQEYENTLEVIRDLKNQVAELESKLSEGIIKTESGWAVAQTINPTVCPYCKVPVTGFFNPETSSMGWDPCPQCGRHPERPLSDYLFCLYEGDPDYTGESKEAYLAIVHKEYWKEHKCLSDQHISCGDSVLGDMLEKVGITEVMESIFKLCWDENQNSLVEKSDKLRALGMTTDPELDQFMATHH